MEHIDKGFEKGDKDGDGCGLGAFHWKDSKADGNNSRTVPANPESVPFQKL